MQPVTHKKIGWLIQPLLYTLFVYYLCYRGEEVKSYIPQLVSFRDASPVDYIPNVSLDRTQIWKLSELITRGGDFTCIKSCWI